MKRTAFFTFCIVLIFLLLPTNYVSAQSNWAQVKVVGEYLYVTPNADSAYTNVVCMLENTYYVNIMYETDDYYKVQYNGVTGYVKRSAVKRVSGTPQNPYPGNIKLSTYSRNCYLRSTPTQNSLGNDIMLLPAGSSGIEFVGKINGTRIEDFGDNTWYYVAFSGKYGYVFSGYIATNFHIYPNDEQLPEASTKETVLNPLSNSAVVIIIVLLLLPMLVILYLMYHKPKVRIRQKVKSKVIEDELL